MCTRELYDTHTHTHTHTHMHINVTKKTFDSGFREASAWQAVPMLISVM